MAVGVRCVAVLLVLVSFVHGGRGAGMTSYVAVSRVAVTVRRSIKQLYKEKRNGWFSKERTSKNY